MKPYIHEGPDGPVTIPRLTVNQIIELQALHWSDEKAALVDDMDSAGVEASDRLERLREARRASESVVALMRLPFSIKWCRVILEMTVPGQAVVESMTPEDASRAAMWCLGYDLDEIISRGQGRAEGKAVR